MEPTQIVQQQLEAYNRRSNGSEKVLDLMLIYEVIDGRIQRFHVARP